MFTRIEGLEKRPAVLGRVKIGYLGDERTSARGTKWRLPLKLSHFIVTTTARENGEGNFELDRDVMEQLGPPCDDADCPVPKPHAAPEELQIMIADDDPDVAFPHHLGYWIGRGKCLCRGNGVDAERREHFLKAVGDEERRAPMVPEQQLAALRAKVQAGDFGAWMKMKCPPDICRYYNEADEKKPRCKVSGRLFLTLPAYRPMLGGVYVWTTGSLESVRSVAFSLDEIRLRTGGILEGIPLRLKVYRKTDQVEGHGAMSSYKVALIFDPGKDVLADLALAERAAKVLDARSRLKSDDLTALRERRRLALKAADAQIVEEVAVDPAETRADREAEGYFGETASMTKAVEAKAELAAAPPAAVTIIAGPGNAGLPGNGGAAKQGELIPAATPEKKKKEEPKQAEPERTDGVPF